jgi:hypothetical protein
MRSCYCNVANVERPRCIVVTVTLQMFRGPDAQ